MASRDLGCYRPIQPAFSKHCSEIVHPNSPWRSLVRDRRSRDEKGTAGACPRPLLERRHTPGCCPASAPGSNGRPDCVPALVASEVAASDCRFASASASAALESELGGRSPPRGESPPERHGPERPPAPGP